MSVRAERAVARKYIGRIQWEMILIALGQFSVWLTVFVLGIRGVLPLWAGFPIAVVCCCLAYLPSHEAQHGNIAGAREELRWLNTLVGNLSLANLCFPYVYARATHMKHHAYTNDPERDPDHHYVADRWWKAALEVHREPSLALVQRHLNEDPVFRKDVTQGVIIRKGFSILMVACAIAWPLPTLLLWWLPSKIGLSYLTVFFSYMPHRPGTERSRYRLARFWQTKFVPRYVVQSMTHHAVHHMYPRIPHWSQPEALQELEPFIVAHGMEGAELLPTRH